MQHLGTICNYFLQLLADWLLRDVCEQRLSPRHLSSAISCHITVPHREIHACTNKQHILQPGLPNKTGLCPPVISDLFLLRKQHGTGGLQRESVCVLQLLCLCVCVCVCQACVALVCLIVCRCACAHVVVLVLLYLRSPPGTVWRSCCRPGLLWDWDTVQGGPQ